MRDGIYFLGHNLISGSIPPSIWNISNLNVLDLARNNISGNLVPMNIINLPCPKNLTKLEVFCCFAQLFSIGS
jgi:hypothetical protein